MKKEFIFLIIIILLVQLLVPIHTLQVILWIFAGFIIAFKFPIKYIFWKAFLIELIIASLFFLILKGEVTFMKDLANQLNLPHVLFPVLFLLVNALTAGFTFQVGHSVRALTKK